jgi:Ca2+-transporting ATPase
MVNKSWHKLSIKETLHSLDTSLSGLSQGDVYTRLKRYGPNEIEADPTRSPWQLFFGQFSSPLIYVLFGATLIAVYVGEIVDASSILIILLINAIIGYTQERKAELSLASIQQLLAPQARVVRDGISTTISAHFITIGDIIVLEEGTQIPADLRLIQAFSIQIDESPLTGESIPIEKDIKTITEETPLSARRNLAYAGTHVVSGHGLGVVVAIAKETEIGQVVEATSVLEEQTPLADELQRIGKTAVLVVLAVTIGIGVIGLIQHRDPISLLLTIVAAAVSAIPEGLPVLITASLAIGVRRLSLRQVAIRRLASLETLGQVDTIVSDKTGTLTENELTVQRLYLPNGSPIEVQGVGYDPTGKILQHSHPLARQVAADVAHLGTIGALANNSSVEYTNGSWQAHGDPTESALMTLAAKLTIDPTQLEASFPREKELPFNSTIRFMATLHRTDKATTFLLAAKGNLAAILGRSKNMIVDGVSHTLNERKKQAILATADLVAAEGYRILGIASGSMKHKGDFSPNINSLAYLGFVAMLDAPRPTARETIRLAKREGIRVMMATGDTAATAQAVSSQLGLLIKGDAAIVGSSLSNLTASELDQVVREHGVFAEVSPQLKLRLVQSLKEQGAVVAVTGDGANDAPIIKAADIGIAMGKGGTDIARGVSDMVLLTNNFDALPAAILEGRRVLSTLRRVVWYLLCTNLSELLLLAAAMLIGLPLPLLPTQLLWINIITDGIAVSGLLFEPIHTKQDGTGTHLITSTLLQQALFVASIIAGLSLWIFALTLRETQSLELARSTAFIGISILQLITLMTSRSLYRSVRTISWKTNPYLFWLIGISLSLTIGITGIHVIRPLIHATPLTQGSWLLIGIASILLLGVIETRKEILQFTSNKK